MRSGAKKNYPRIYKIWQGIRQRCNNPNNKDYNNYGGRGIKVCEGWILKGRLNGTYNNTKKVV